MGRRGRRRKMSYAAERYKRKQKKRELVAKKEAEQRLLAAPTTPAPLVIYPRSELPKHRLLLPRPEPRPVTLVAASGSSSNNASISTAADPKMPAAKKIYFLGPNSVLYEVLASSAGVPGTAPQNQKIVLPDISSSLHVPSLVPLKQDPVEVTQGSSSTQSSSTTKSVVDLEADTPVEEIQVKVELPEFLCEEELVSSESDDEVASGDKRSCGKTDEDTKSADTSHSFKEERLSEDEEEEEILSEIIKKEEITLDDDPLDSPRSQEGDDLDTNSNQTENVQKSSLSYPRKVPLRPNHTNTDDSLYCDECDEDFVDDCPTHGPLNVVDDTPVTANINDKLRAKKTAPSLISIADSDIPGVGSGVWARDVIPSRTRFGPFDGKIVSADVCNSHTWLIRLNGKPGYCIDASEPGLSNWMRYVATARRAGEQNLRPFQRFGKLYFRTTRQIEPYEELLLINDSLEKGSIDAEVFGLRFTDEWDESSIENPSNSSHSVFVTADLPVKAKRDRFSDGEETDETDSNPSDVLRKTSAVNVETSTDGENRNFTAENLLSCLICKARFLFEETLHDHLKTHDVANQLECAVCSERFFDESSLEKHQEIHTSDDVQPSSFVRITEGVVADSKKRRNNRYVCSLCNAWFIYEESLKYHVQTHSAFKHLECHQCGEWFWDRKSLNKHVEIHKVVTLTCPVCEKEFQVLASYNRHIATHTRRFATCAEKLFACSFCDKQFVERTDFDEHQKVHPDLKQFVCDVCREVFVREDVLVEHRETHKKVNLFACRVCDAWFANAQQLNGHLRVHKAPKTLECSRCNEKFSRESELKEHLRTHNQYECNVCGMQFTELNDWTRHRESHGLDYKFNCKLCNLTFRRSQELDKHVLLHQERLPLQCKFCKETFSELRFLRKHVRVDHEDRFGLQTWKSWEAWKSQGCQNQSR